MKASVSQRILILPAQNNKHVIHVVICKGQFTLTRSTEHGRKVKMSEFPLFDSHLHGAPSTDENSRVEHISIFPLKTLYLIMRTHDLYVEV